jgi:hypothetical protein
MGIGSGRGTTRGSGRNCGAGRTGCGRSLGVPLKVESESELERVLSGLSGMSREWRSSELGRLFDGSAGSWEHAFGTGLGAREIPRLAGFWLRDGHRHLFFLSPWLELSGQCSDTSWRCWTCWQGEAAALGAELKRGLVLILVLIVLHRDSLNKAVTEYYAKRRRIWLYRLYYGSSKQRNELKWIPMKSKCALRSFCRGLLAFSIRRPSK